MKFASLFTCTQCVQPSNQKTKKQGLSGDGAEDHEEKESESIAGSSNQQTVVSTEPSKNSITDLQLAINRADFITKKREKFFDNYIVGKRLEP